jgi:hypothetical protein
LFAVRVLALDKSGNLVPVDRIHRLAHPLPVGLVVVSSFSPMWISTTVERTTPSASGLEKQRRLAGLAVARNP